MAEGRRYGLTPQLDIEQILLEAQHRWLRPAEICEILRNYHKFCITPEPQNKPTSGSLFLFDRKVLRYFRKDGHNWRKKKDGKTVKEAHERLKAGSIDVLHCYYAHGEENESFQRRSYWMLEEDFMHIVLVHYRDVKGNKTSRTKNVEVIPQGTYDSSPVGSNSQGSHTYVASQTTDAESHISSQTSRYEDSEIDNYQASSRYHSYVEMPQFDDKPMMDASHMDPWFPVSQDIQGNHRQQGAISTASEFDSLAREDITKVFNEKGLGCTLDGPRSQIGSASWNEVLGHCTTGFQSYVPPQVPSTYPASMESVPKRTTVMFSEVFTSELCTDQVDATTIQGQGNLQGGALSDVDSLIISDRDGRSAAVKEGNAEYHAILKQLSLEFPNAEGGEVLKKHDSFSRWMSRELGEVDDSHIKTSLGIDWDVVESENVPEDSSLSQQDHLYPYVLSPSLSQDQLYSIIDFSPNWAYAGLETKVLITGKFLKNENEVEQYKWSCMFGEVEVPAEILADGILRCCTPPHKPGRVPFYVTCSNRLACSQVREFEYLLNHAQYLESSEFYAGSKNEMLLHIRLEKLLSLGPTDPLEPISSSTGDKSLVRTRISSLLLEADDEWSHLLMETTDKEYSPSIAKDQLLQKLLKEKLHAWLLHKVVEDGKGPNILDQEGQGVIHIAAALGYDWAIAPTMIAGVNINFRDVCGWSALHWAAFCGRERTVVALVYLGAAPGALSDPTPEFPSGRTPADLASHNGHKGIAGFLAKYSLTAHLSTLTIRDSGLSEITGISHTKTIEDTVEGCGIQFDEGGMQVGSSLEDSLSAVRVATQAAARIHQVFRVHSFHRKKLVECGDNNFGLSDEQAVSLLAVKVQKAGQLDEPVHAAAIRIQNKFRGWKGRKEFTVIRQRIVKIQAHVRGHQVRKHFRKVVWSVGIVEKAILRWRRKGCGLRGFRSGALTEGSNMQKEPTKEEDYDYLQVGRKQTEARLEKALARVKSMVQYPDARDQYQRLLAGVKEFKESKVLERILNDPEEKATDGYMIFDLEELGEGTPMPPA